MSQPDYDDLVDRARGALRELGCAVPAGPDGGHAADEAYRLLALLDAHALAGRMLVGSRVTLDPPGRAEVTTSSFEQALPQPGADFRAAVEKATEAISLLIPYRDDNDEARLTAGLALLGSGVMLLNALMVHDRPAQPVMVGSEPLVLPDSAEMLGFARTNARDALQILDELGD